MRPVLQTLLSQGQEVGDAGNLHGHRVHINAQDLADAPVESLGTPYARSIGGGQEAPHSMEEEGP